MSIGYACIALAVPGASFRTATLKNATPARLDEVIGANLDALDTVLKYNADNRIFLFRISSDLIPLASHTGVPYDWRSAWREKLADTGDLIRRLGIRVSMHPGQYSVLNSPDPDIVQRTVDDLRYHCDLMDAMKLDPTHKIILHIGGAYGDKSASAERFLSNWKKLDNNIKSRLVAENDENRFHIGDLLEIHDLSGIPVVFDALHDKLNPAPGSAQGLREEDVPDLVKRCAKTWSSTDGRQKIHYSQQENRPGSRSGGHSSTIGLDEFLKFKQSISGSDTDIMLEVKDKNISALKCICATDANLPPRILESEWAHYKYLVMSRSARPYNRIRELFSNGKPDRESLALDFYRIVEDSLHLDPDIGAEINAAQHVWGYFKDVATESEKRAFQKNLADIPAAKRQLYRLAQKYGSDYLLRSYYFTR
jgi:UV DNA damage endonuclease